MFENVILIGHKSRQGKDTFAQFLMDNSDWPVQRLQYSGRMKEILAELKQVSLEDLEELKNNDPKCREKHQRFGSGKMKEFFGEDVWVQQVIKQLTDPETLYVIDDFRFNIERLPGAHTVKVVRPLADVPLFDTSHASECELECYEFDHTIINNSTLEDLEIQAIDLLVDLGFKE